MTFSGESMLGRTLPFSGLGATQLRAVLALAEVRRLRADAVVFDEGQPARRFYLLVSGHIRFARLTADGDQIIVLHIPSGQMFGIGAALGQTTHQTSAITANPCVVLSWPNALWSVFSLKYKGFADECLRSFGARADEMSKRIVELSTKLVEQRIACALLRMIGQSGRKVAGGIEISFPVSRQNIADMTGTTLYTVSRVLSAWERQGTLKTTRCLILVRDPHRLVLLSGAAVGGYSERDEVRAARQPPYVIAPITAARNSARNSTSSRPYSAQASITV